jgi:hypothetical protein
MTNALDTQVGGTHYKDMPIQPLEYIVANELLFCEGNVVKYVSRWRSKNGVEDLRKARHYLDMLIQEHTQEVALELRHSLKEPIDGNK